jgi:hypothetical protein
MEIKYRKEYKLSTLDVFDHISVYKSNSESSRRFNSVYSRISVFFTNITVSRKNMHVIQWARIIGHMPTVNCRCNTERSNITHSRLVVSKVSSGTFQMQR